MLDLQAITGGAPLAFLIVVGLAVAVPSWLYARSKYAHDRRVEQAASKLIDDAYQRGYDAGVRDGKADFQMRDISAANEAFERGRRAGWRQGGDQFLDEVHAALHGGREIRDSD